MKAICAILWRMEQAKELWRGRVASVLAEAAGETDAGTEEWRNLVTAELPPDPDMGDLGFPMFPFAKRLRRAPQQIAADCAERLSRSFPDARILAAGPYVNVFLPKAAFAARILAEAAARGEDFGKPGNLAGRRIMVEFSSPNTNKPLHLGHLRNDALGESISRILQFCGAEVYKVNIINDRGVHICKSMLAYSKFFAGKTPADYGVKPDRFVGDCYVKFNEYSKEDPERADREAKELLRLWEQGDEETLALWKTMNGWALEGMMQTYRRTGVSFDKIYFESQTYLKGKEEVLAGLEKGVFFRAEDGSVCVDLAPLGMDLKADRKVLLRSDGTSVYMTQDIGTAVSRQDDWPFDTMIYVVGSEQQYHFKVLFYVLRLLGFPWADRLYHLSYGMVNLPDGKMKSREGTVVDGDDLLNRLRDGALAEIRGKERESLLSDADATAENIALGALHYFLLQVSPTKDMLFHPQESLSFNGNTGPYLQYMGARISSILKRFAEDGNAAPAREAPLSPELLVHPAEWALLKTIASFSGTAARAAENRDPSLITGFLYTLAKDFSRFYHDCPVLPGENRESCPPALSRTRLELIRAAANVLKTASRLVLVPFLTEM